MAERRSSGEDDVSPGITDAEETLDRLADELRALWYGNGNGSGAFPTEVEPLAPHRDGDQTSDLQDDAILRGPWRVLPTDAQGNIKKRKRSLKIVLPDDFVAPIPSGAQRLPRMPKFPIFPEGIPRAQPELDEAVLLEVAARAEALARLGDEEGALAEAARSVEETALADAHAAAHAGVEHAQETADAARAEAARIARAQAELEARLAELAVADRTATEPAPPPVGRTLIPPPAPTVAPPVAPIAPPLPSHAWPAPSAPPGPPALPSGIYQSPSGTFRTPSGRPLPAPIPAGSDRVLVLRPGSRRSPSGAWSRPTGPISPAPSGTFATPTGAWPAPPPAPPAPAQQAPMPMAPAPLTPAAPPAPMPPVAMPEPVETPTAPLVAPAPPSAAQPAEPSISAAHVARPSPSAAASTPSARARHATTARVRLFPRRAASILAASHEVPPGTVARLDAEFLRAGSRGVYPFPLDPKSRARTAYEQVLAFVRPAQPSIGASVIDEDTLTAVALDVARQAVAVAGCFEAPQPPSETAVSVLIRRAGESLVRLPRATREALAERCPEVFGGEGEPLSSLLRRAETTRSDEEDDA